MYPDAPRISIPGNTRSLWDFGARALIVFLYGGVEANY